MIVRPWNPPEKAMTAARPVAARAILTAFSTASAPVDISTRLVRALAGRERVQLLAERDIRLIRRDLEAGVGDLVELGAHGLHHAAVAMAGVEHGDAAREVDVAPALGVPQQRILGALDEDRVGHGHAARDGGLAPGNQ